MSLISSISSRSPQDLINEGYKLPFTGSVNTVTDSVIFTATSSRSAIVTGFTLSTSSTSAILVSLGFRINSTTTTFFSGYIKDNAPISRDFALGDWYRGSLGANLVITSAGNNVAYSIDARIVSSPTPLGYIENWGAQNASAHSGKAWMPDASGLARGLSEI